jgi:dihydrodipicolinate synthase/N-acetylneuraminate lyase
VNELEFFSGVVVPMVSPFNLDYQVDTEAVQRIVESVVAAGVHGIFVLGTTGESASIDPAHKGRIVSAAGRAVDSQTRRVALYAGISGNCLTESVDNAAKWREAGADAVVAHAPYYYPVTDAMLEKYYEKLADQSPLPLLLYNIPQTTHLSIPLETISRLSGHGNIIGIKDSQRDLPRLTKLIEEHRGSRFRVLVGSISLSCESLKLGAHGLVPSTANFAAGAFVAMYNAGRAGNWSEAEARQVESDRLSAQYQQGVTLGESIAKLKAIMAWQGLCSPVVLPPLQTITAI